MTILSINVGAFCLFSLLYSFSCFSFCFHILLFSFYSARFPFFVCFIFLKDIPSFFFLLFWDFQTTLQKLEDTMNKMVFFVFSFESWVDALFVLWEQLNISLSTREWVKSIQKQLNWGTCIMALKANEKAIITPNISRWQINDLRICEDIPKTTKQIY